MIPSYHPIYRCPYNIEYHDPVCGKNVTVPDGYASDGATGPMVPDLWSESWWVHDVLCDRGAWDDGTPCTNWDASRVLGDILRSEGRWFRARTWRWATWLFGGGKCRENGMWRGKGTP